MSPRPYAIGQRQAASEQTRSRIIRAARQLLVQSETFSGFTIEAVARQAGVARMTVYYQFGSKAGLIEALCDSLAMHGGMEQMAAVFQEADSLDALDRFIDVFAHFWDSDRAFTRRLHGLAALDPDIAKVIASRQERRRKGLRTILSKPGERKPRWIGNSLEETIDVLYTLISFEVFESLAGPTRHFEEVAPLLKQLVRAVLDLEPDRPRQG
jgi:AcrR family transcriptional regulator